MEFVEVSRCRDVSVGGGSNCGGHPYISFLFRMNFFISLDKWFGCIHSLDWNTGMDCWNGIRSGMTTDPPKMTTLDCQNINNCYHVLVFHALH